MELAQKSTIRLLDAVGHAMDSLLEIQPFAQEGAQHQGQHDDREVLRLDHQRHADPHGDET